MSNGKQFLVDTLLPTLTAMLPINYGETDRRLDEIVKFCHFAWEP